jgi:hypothetical protein
VTRHPLFTQGLSVAVILVPFSISGYVELERFLGGIDGSRLVRRHGVLYREVSCLIRSEHHGCFLTGLAVFARQVFPWRIVDVQIEGDTPEGRTTECVPNVGASNGEACPACDRDATARPKAFLINRQAERAILLARVIWLLQHRAEQLASKCYVVVRIEGDPTTDAWFRPFTCLLSQRFGHTAFVCDDAVEYVINDVRGDDLWERLALIVAMAMYAKVPPGVDIQVVKDAPVAPSTAPRCIRCGRQFDHEDVRSMGCLLARPLPLLFAITCPEHDPAFAVMPKEVTHAH